MPIINISDGEDWLKQYQRYRATVWYRRISRKQWAIYGLVGGGGIGLLVGATSLIQSAVANFNLFSGPGIRLFGGG